MDSFFLGADVYGEGVLSTPFAIELENNGAVPVTFLDISMDIPGLRLPAADRQHDEEAAVTVQGGGGTIWRRSLVITDCAAVPREPQPIRVTYRTWLGRGESEVILESQSLSGPEGSIPIAWQRAVAADVCNEAVSR